MSEDGLAKVILLHPTSCDTRGRHSTHPSTWGKSGTTTCTTCGKSIHVEVTEGDSYDDTP